MVKLVLVSHGGLAQGLQTSLSMFAADKMAEVIALGLQDGESLDDFRARVVKELAFVQDGGQVLVLADIVGGSPLTTVASVLDDFGQLDGTLILGGMNLTMALTALVMKDMLSGQALEEAILKEAASALQPLKLSVVEEDDDI